MKRVMRKRKKNVKEKKKEKIKGIIEDKKVKCIYQWLSIANKVFARSKY
jgi:hypothetical protein